MMSQQSVGLAWVSTSENWKSFLVSVAIFTRKLLTVNQRLRLQSCLRCSKVSSKSPKHTDKQAADNQKADFLFFFKSLTSSRSSGQPLREILDNWVVLKKYLDNFFKRFSTTVENWKAHWMCPKLRMRSSHHSRRAMMGWWAPFCFNLLNNSQSL
jgi:hypothetical protein